MDPHRAGWIAVAAALFLLAAPAVFGAGRPRIAVMEIDDLSRTLKPRLLVALTEQLRGALTATGRYVVIDKTRQAKA